MGLAKEFRDFAVKGNAIDMAVGIVIGAAFSSIVNSLVNDIIMPPIGMLLGHADFKDLALTLKEKVTGPDGKIITDAVTVKYGLFINNIINFLIVAFAIFMVIRTVNRLTRMRQAPTA
jgi:large conductance mechanosensitive channel